MLLFCPIMLVFCPLMFPLMPKMFLILDIMNEASGLLLLFSQLLFSSCPIMFLILEIMRYLGFRPSCSFSIIPNKEFLFPFHSQMFLLLVYHQDKLWGRVRGPTWRGMSDWIHWEAKQVGGKANRRRRPKKSHQVFGRVCGFFHQPFPSYIFTPITVFPLSLTTKFCYNQLTPAPLPEILAWLGILI